MILSVDPRAASADASAKLNLEQPHEAGVGLAFMWSQFRDDLLNNLRWSGPGVVLAGRYAHRRWVDRHEVDLSLGAAILSNRYGDGGLQIKSVLSYGYWRTLPRDSVLGLLQLGGRVTWDWNDQYFASWDEEHLYWLTAIDLAPAFRMDRAFGARHELIIGLSFALLGVVSRPDELRFYKAGDLTSARYQIATTHSNMHFTSLCDYRALRLNVDYRLNYHRRRALEFGYELAYLNYDQPQPIRLLANLLWVRFLFYAGGGS